MLVSTVDFVVGGAVVGFDFVGTFGVLVAVGLLNRVGSFVCAVLLFIEFIEFKFVKFVVFFIKTPEKVFLVEF